MKHLAVAQAHIGIVVDSPELLFGLLILVQVNDMVDVGCHDIAVGRFRRDLAQTCKGLIRRKRIKAEAEELAPLSRHRGPKPPRERSPGGSTSPARRTNCRYIPYRVRRAALPVRLSVSRRARPSPAPGR